MRKNSGTKSLSKKGITNSTQRRVRVFKSLGEGFEGGNQVAGGGNEKPFKTPATKWKREGRSKRGGGCRKKDLVVGNEKRMNPGSQRSDRSLRGGNCEGVLGKKGRRNRRKKQKGREKNKKKISKVIRSPGPIKKRVQPPKNLEKNMCGAVE